MRLLHLIEKLNHHGVRPRRRISIIWCLRHSLHSCRVRCWHHCWSWHWLRCRRRSRHRLGSWRWLRSRTWFRCSHRSRLRRWSGRQFWRWFFIHCNGICKRLQKSLCQFFRHDVHKFAVQLSLNFQTEPNNYHACIFCKIFIFKFLRLTDLKRSRCGDIDNGSQKLRQSRSRRTHHLIHNLADGADI